MCGENQLSGQIQGLDEGSPPRVRGKPAVFQAEDDNQRITPACAGKTVDIMADIAVQ